MNIEYFAIIFVLTTFTFLLSGYPVAFVLSGISLIFAYFGIMLEIFDYSYLLAFDVFTQSASGLMLDLKA